MRSSTASRQRSHSRYGRPSTGLQSGSWGGGQVDLVSDSSRQWRGLAARGGGGKPGGGGGAPHNTTGRGPGGAPQGQPATLAAGGPPREPAGERRGPAP